MEKVVIFDAIDFAVKAHRGQFRKGSFVPYIIHPVNVGSILIKSGCSDEVVVAGILHDTVEDTYITVQDIDANFGDKIASLVKAVSEPNKNDTWENRKKHTIEMLKTAPLDIVMIEIADKLDNIRSILDDYYSRGDKVWKKFKKGKNKQAWYYNSLVEVFAGRLKEEPGLSLFEEFRGEVEAVFEMEE